jgi:septal ring factor EnvC (AmiA/AmiB activator)
MTQMSGFGIAPASLQHNSNNETEFAPKTSPSSSPRSPGPNEVSSSLTLCSNDRFVSQALVRLLIIRFQVRRLRHQLLSISSKSQDLLHDLNEARAELKRLRQLHEVQLQELKSDLDDAQANAKRSEKELAKLRPAVGESRV